jgi:hypothetical protein
MVVASIRQIVSLPPGTCCARAVQEFLRRFPDFAPSLEINEVTNFFEGRLQIEADKGNSRTLFLIPDINEINTLITEAAGWCWHPELSFAYENPPLWFARGCKDKTLPAYAARCASIQALRPLLEQDSSFTKPEGLKFLDVHSTQEAALAAADGECGWAVTNQEGVDKYHLRPVRRLKHMVVFWKAFTFQPDMV